MARSSLGIDATNSTNSTKIVARRKPSDFQSSARGVSLYSGTCSCCCCCLHWIGALAGGWAGYAWAWKREEQRDVVRNHSHIAFALGMVGAVIGIIFAAVTEAEWLVVGWVIPLLAAPFVFFIPAGLFVAFSTLSSRRVDVPHLTEFVERDAPEDERGAYRTAAAEEQRLLDKPIFKSRNREELGALLRVGFFTVLFSLMGTVIGYLVMVVLFFLIAGFGG